MSLSANIARNNGGQVQLTTPLLPSAQADYFKLYWATIPGGPYTFLKTFPNAADITTSAGSALVYLYRSEIGLTTEDSFYVKITSVKGVTESLIADSNETSIPREGGETSDDLADDVATAVEAHGYNTSSQRWLRQKVDADGRLEINVGAVTLPAGLATETKQDAGNASLVSINGKLATLGQKTMAGSEPVVIASDQSAVPITVVTLPLPTGASTAANQTTLGNQTTKINDGTNTAAVKAASVAAVASDPALVVAISPNNTVPTSDTFTAHVQTAYPVVAATPVNLTGAGGAIAVPLAGRKSVLIQNLTGAAMYVGDATGQEFRLNNNDSVPFFGCTAGVSVYGRAPSGAGTIVIWEFAT